jgi:hypothetical protein
LFRYILRSENRVIFCLSVLLIAGLGMSVLFDFDLTRAVDQKSYWGMAYFDFNTSPHRKYRFVIPMLAAAVNWIIQSVAHIFNRNALAGDFSMKFSFYFVNCMICAMWCTLIFRYCRAYGIGRLGALFGLLTVVTNRWTPQHVGTPHTDLLFCLAIVCMLYGIRARKDVFIYAAIFLGPFSKESFLFSAPVLLFSYWPKWKTVLWLGIAGALVFGSRYIIDTVTDHPPMQSIAADWGVVLSFWTQVVRLKIIGYWIEMFAGIGLWWLLPVAEKALLKRTPRTRRFLREPYIVVFLITMVFQIFLNGDYARMIYTLSPVYAVVIGFSVDRLYAHWKNTREPERVISGD